MQEIFYNDSNLTKEEIDKTIIRVKAVIINDKEEILLASSWNTYQFPGGHLENNETIENALKREIFEETGIIIKNINKPFLLIRSYHKNYRTTNENRENLIYYYQIKTNELPHLDNLHLDDLELKGNYHIDYFPLNKIEKYLNETINLNPINKIIYEEMKTVLKHLKKLNSKT